ncbi:IucA/IucC family protein [Exiguobacterium antarcticum]|uniref:IucA/IucC family protein n=1 Tax=Exiguobacterium antarcticum TaxID=132920 RepID=A0ABT6R017_9BACL|nr:IucA/IucC family protein [Exiguobacterium antarcticum]MDI3234286.1 IucA/IucC family protein [Exiguobacterium antarcticum]
MSRLSERRVCKQLLEAILFERIEPFIEHRRPKGKTTFRFVRPPYELTIEGGRGAFDRVWLELETAVLTQHQQVQPLTLKHVLDCFQIEDQLRQELKQTVQLDEICPRLIVARTNLSYEVLEQALVEGHPYHPCFKPRIGFSNEDHWRYGPEAGQRFRLRFVALPTSVVRATRMDGVMEKTFGRTILAQLETRLTSLTSKWENYQILPVHPWQWARVEREVERCGGIDLGETGPHFQATQSIRTVFQPEAPDVPHLKFPLDLMQTSARRTFTVPNIMAAPSVSDWLTRWTDGKHVTLLREFASQVVETEDGRLSGRIGCLYRDNVLANVTANETVVPLTALPLRETTGALFLDPWVKTYGLEPWLKQFLSVYLEPVFQLLIEEGIAIEAHAQNTLLVLEDGWPTRLIVRDFHDSVEYVTSFVRQREDIPDFEAIHPAFRSSLNTYYEMADVEALRELIMDTVFVFHLTELSHQLEAQYGLKEATFFDWVVETLAGLQLPPDRLAVLELDAPMIQAESLVTRKFKTTQTQHLVRNPLAAETKKGSETYAIH